MEFVDSRTPKYHVKAFGEEKSPQKPPKPRGSVDLYAVQCEKCLKWRTVATKREFETLRHNFTEDPWVCDKKPGITCDDPADLEYDNTRIWAFDKPNIPKPPPDTERILILRKDLSKMDAMYIMPNGKRVRSSVEVQKFLYEYPQYKRKMDISDFSFQSPRMIDGVDPKAVIVKVSPGSTKKKTRA